MKKTGGQIVCESLILEGVDVIFGIPGGAILPLYQTLSGMIMSCTVTVILVINLAQ